MILLHAALVALLGFAAHPAGAARFAVVVGNNLGAQENQPLRYAERDAAQVASVMRTLGHVEHVEFAARNTRPTTLRSEAEASWPSPPYRQARVRCSSTATSRAS